jgi:hypothetical protein
MSDAIDSAVPPESLRLAWSRAADWICAAAVLALWLISRPYRGVRHDAVLYTGQVLAKLLPDRIGTDLFFVYGSQDKYSLFSSLVAPLVERFGVGPTELALLLLCNLVFVVACWDLMRRWFARPLCWVALLFVSVMPHTYGGLGAFSYAEPFLTGRSFAEPLALLALSQLLRGRLAVAVGFALLGAAFHPLIALPVLVIGWGVLIQQHRSWLWLAALLLVPVALAILGVAPFSGMAQRFDAQWFALVQAHNANAFIVTNTILDWAPLAFDALVLGLCLRLEATPPLLRRLILSMLVAVAAFTTLWGLGADLLHDVLLTQLQLWRIYWPMHLLAVMLLPALGIACWQRGWVGKWCVAALALAAVAVLSNWRTGWLCIVWALLALLADFTRAKVSRTTAIAAAVASFVAMLGISARVAQVTQMAIDRFPDRFGHVAPAMIIISLPFVGGLLALLVVRLAGGGTGRRVVAAVLAIAGVVFGVGVWDQRSPWQQRLEGGATTVPPAFESDIPAHASVYWDDSLIDPWLLARQANFFVKDQGAGLLFNRATAMEFDRRERATAGFELQHELCSAVAAMTSQAGSRPPGCAMSRESVIEVCSAPLHPDFLVFETPLSLPAVAEWHDMAASADASRHSFYLYSCARLR